MLSWKGRLSLDDDSNPKSPPASLVDWVSGIPDTARHYWEVNPLTARLALLLVVVHVLQWRLRSIGLAGLEFGLFHVQGWMTPHPLSTLTSTIAHLDVGHLLINTGGLLLFGPALERRISDGLYGLAFFGIGGLAGGLQVELMGGSALGASGAVLAFFPAWAAYVLPGIDLSRWPLLRAFTGNGLAWFLLLGMPVAVALGPTPLGALFGNMDIGHLAHGIGLGVGYLILLALVQTGHSTALREPRKQDFTANG